MSEDDEFDGFDYCIVRYRDTIQEGYAEWVHHLNGWEEEPCLAPDCEIIAWRDGSAESTILALRKDTGKWRWSNVGGNYMFYYDLGRHIEDVPEELHDEIHALFGQIFKDDKEEDFRRSHFGSFVGY